MLVTALGPNKFGKLSHWGLRRRADKLGCVKCLINVASSTGQSHDNSPEVRCGRFFESVDPVALRITTTGMLSNGERSLHFRLNQDRPA
jgi:hypothetical protein